MIEVTLSAGDEWLVSIKGTVTTHHRVRVVKKDVERLAGDRSAEELLQESMRFLLEREPNTSIMPSFDLPLIGRYSRNTSEKSKHGSGERTELQAVYRAKRLARLKANLARP